MSSVYQTTEPHPLYPDRKTETFAVRGQVMPGWFSGQAAIWTGGSSPRVIGPFDTVADAQKYLADHAPGAQIFPFDTPE